MRLDVPGCFSVEVIFVAVLIPVDPLTGSLAGGSWLPWWAAPCSVLFVAFHG